MVSHEKIDGGKAPLKSKTKKKVVGIDKRKRRTNKHKKKLPRRKREPKGVVYISHIPHGFYEEQIEAYFSQFGKVTAVSVPRSKTKRAKGYAFIEYKHPEIAKIAAETMNNYLMFNRLLKAKFIPPEQQKPRLFWLAKHGRENQQTLADKAASAVKHNRKVKNRHLKIGLEVKRASKLLKKKNSLLKRAEKFGLSNDVSVEEANVQSIFEKKKEIETYKKDKNNKTEDAEEEEEETDLSEGKSSLSSLNDENDDSTQSSETDELLSDDGESIELQSESDEEDYKKMIVKAKEAAKSILKKKPKSTKLQTPVSIELPGKNKKKKEKILGEKNIPQCDKLQSSKVDSKSKLKNTPLKVALSNTRKDVDTHEKSVKCKKPRSRKSLNKNGIISSLKKAQSPVKKNKASTKTSRNRELERSQVVMEVDTGDEEVVFKTPPGIVKKFIQPQNILSSKGQKLNNKTPKKENNSSNETKSPLGRKPRHRKLKKMLAAQ